MALIGNCSHTIYTEHETELTTTTVTRADGTTEDITSPRIIETVTDYTNIYLCIKQLDHYNYYEVDDEGNYHKFGVIHFRYAAYTDRATRDDDQENFLFSDVANLQDYDYNGNLYSQIYAQIKTFEGKTNLTDG